METDNQLAGTDTVKAAAFMDLWANPDIDVIMASCGGNFSAQFLHLLDFEKIAQKPKPVMGFSDTTALLSALYTKTGQAGYFGPTVQTLGRLENPQQVFEVIFNQDNRFIDFSDCSPLSFIEKNDKSPIRGKLYAATLSVLVSLIGTPYFPNLSGHILILEDIGEELSRLDRMLWQLNEVCPFRNLSALLFGEFVDLQDTGRPLGLSFEDIIKKHTASANIPVFVNAPVGHGKKLTPIPLGVQALLDRTPSSIRLILE
jgi:muramoyltetrapeptide carboxypeptidase